MSKAHQSRGGSFRETLVGTGLRLTVNSMLTNFVFGLYGVHLGVSDTLGVTALFTCVSISISYTLLRVKQNRGWFK